MKSQRVIVLKAHGNCYGPVYERADGGGLTQRPGNAWSKLPGNAYDHPDPTSLIAERLVALPAPLDGDGDGRPGGSAPGRRPRKRQAKG